MAPKPLDGPPTVLNPPKVELPELRPIELESDPAEVKRAVDDVKTVLDTARRALGEHE